MNRSVRVTVFLAVIAAAPVAGYRWFFRAARPQAAAPRVSSVTAPRADTDTPLGRVLIVLSQGGSHEQVDAAIEFLDTCSRLRTPLDVADRVSLIAVMARGAPSGMMTGSWAHLFNSACNALSAGGTPPDPTLVTLLERLAADGSVSHMMRLYALQHLGTRYSACDQATRDRIRTIVSGILAEPASPVAGTALVLSSGWESPDNRIGTEHSGTRMIFDSARQIAVDSSRSVDVRVTALHVAGDNPAVLVAARTLASDASQPTILRKAALSLIGRHGTADDLPLLRNCSAGSIRMAQAAGPASKAIQARLDGKTQPVLTPY